jgi:6-phosphogluconolactonase/glucosamine-6-phosphate isomerase/deaminase
MHFMKTADQANGEVDLAEELRKGLFAEQKILWLVPGGSNVPTTVTVMQQISEAPLKNLTIMLGDERYGQVGHPDSNSQQLTEAGFDPGEATFIPVLENKPLSDTVADYAKMYDQVSSSSDRIIGQFGIGADGHIAGILPGSPAVLSEELAAEYRGGGFTRITLTPMALKRVNAAYVFAWGESKLLPLTNLRDKDLSLSEQPSQLLRQFPEAYIYNDQIGDNE